MLTISAIRHLLFICILWNRT